MSAPSCRCPCVLRRQPLGWPPLAALPGLTGPSSADGACTELREGARVLLPCVRRCSPQRRTWTQGMHPPRPRMPLIFFWRRPR